MYSLLSFFCLASHQESSPVEKLPLKIWALITGKTKVAIFVYSYYIFFIDYLEIVQHALQPRPFSQVHPSPL